jgi:hypothetical protein
VIDELLNLSPTISDPQEVAAGNPNRPSDADLRPLEPLPQAPQSRYPAAADPAPMNPEDNRRLSVYPHVEVEPTANVCPSGPSRDAGDQVRTSAAREGERSKLRFRSWQWPTSAPEEGSAGEHGAILPRRHDGRHPAALSARLITIVETSSWSVEPLSTS